MRAGLNKIIGTGLNLAVQAGMRRLSAVSGRLLHLPTKVWFEIERGCNLRCRYCDAWRRPQRGGLELGDWLRLLREARRWIGPFSLSFGSGEPLLAPEKLLPLIREASSFGVLTTCVTNGTLLDRPLLDALRAAGLGRLMISLDSADAATHDQIRGAAGVFASAVRGVRLALSLKGGPSVYILSVVSDRNAGRLPEILEWAAGEGVDGLTLQPLSGYKPGRDMLVKDQAALDLALDRLAAMKAAGYPLSNSAASLKLIRAYYAGLPFEGKGALCGSYHSLRVYADGEVRSCAHKPALGNAGKAGLEGIWDSSHSRETLRAIAACRGYCMLNNTNFGEGFAERCRNLLCHAAGRRMQ